MDTSFRQGIQFVLQAEGGFVNDAADPGGATNRGITQLTYDAFRKKNNLPRQSVKFISVDEVWTIYKTGYWDKVGCTDLPLPVDIVAFDSAVNCGPGRVADWLKASANADANAYAQALLNCRLAHYTAIIKANPKLERFRQGWLNRVNALRKEVGI